MRACQSRQVVWYAFAVALAVSMLMVGCDAPGHRTKPVPSVAAPAGVLCSNPTVRCRSANIPGGGTVDYVIVSAKEQAEPRLVLLEAGGPGFDVYGRSDASFVVLPEALATYDVLLLREPWTATEPPSVCQSALHALGDMLSADLKDLPTDSTGCQLSGWTASSYLKALSAVIQTENRPLNGIIGQSYGALPAAEAARRWPNAWLILNAPIAPPSLSATDLLTGRQTALDSALDRSFQNSCKNFAGGCARTGTEVTAAALTRMREHSIAQRSAPLRTGDLDLAIMSAAYDLQANQKWLWRTLSALPDIGVKDWVTIGRLADQLVQRSGGGGNISVRFAAYFSGLCPAYTGWSSAAHERSHIPILLHVIATYCAKDPSAPALWSTGVDADRAGAVCLYVNEDDTVVNPVQAEAWARIFPSTRVHRVRYLGHLPLEPTVRQAAAGPACLPLSKSS